MTLNSLPFLVFLPAVFFGLQLLKHRFAWAYLLLASYAFYAALLAPHLLVVLAFVTVVTFECGIRIGRQSAGMGRKASLWFGIGTCLVVLATTKYLPPEPSPHFRPNACT